MPTTEQQPTAPTLAEQIAQLVAGYVAAKAAARAATVNLVLSVWDSLTSWRDRDIDRFAKAVVPAVTGAQQHVAALTAAFIAQSLTLAGATPGRPNLNPHAISGAALRAGTPPLDVYHRPGLEVWTALSNDTPLAQAVANGRLRAQQLAQTDVQLASTHAAQQAMSASPHVVGYRRVLTGPHSCALCAVAATQRYKRAELLPIHPGCDCTVAPIIGTTDPGRVLDQDALDQAHADIQSRLGTDTNDAASLRKMLVVHHHGELGPVLAEAGQHFTGPAAIPQ